MLQPQAVEAIMPDQEHQHQREGDGVYHHRPPATRQRSNTESEFYSIKRCLEGGAVQRTQGERRGAVRLCRRTGEDLLALVAALADHRNAGFLGIEDARAAFEAQRFQAGHLQQRAVGREVALEHHDAARGGHRL